MRRNKAALGEDMRRAREMFSRIVGTIRIDDKKVTKNMFTAQIIGIWKAKSGCLLKASENHSDMSGVGEYSHEIKRRNTIGNP